MDGIIYSKLALNCLIRCQEICDLYINFLVLLLTDKIYFLCAAFFLLLWYNLGAAIPCI